MIVPASSIFVYLLDSSSSTLVVIISSCMLMFIFGCHTDWAVLLSTIGVTANLFFKVTCERLSYKYEA